MTTIGFSWSVLAFLLDGRPGDLLGLFATLGVEEH